MYGLRKAPKKWEEARNAGLKELMAEPQELGEKRLSLLQWHNRKEHLVDQITASSCPIVFLNWSKTIDKSISMDSTFL